MLIGMHPSEGISPLVQSIKIQSTSWMRDKKGVAGFAWQSGFAAFSYSKSQLPQVMNYISNQKQHHKQRTFDDEMLEIAERSGIEYDARYLLKGIEE